MILCKSNNKKGVNLKMSLFNKRSLASAFAIEGMILIFISCFFGHRLFTRLLGLFIPVFDIEASALCTSGTFDITGLAVSGVLGYILLFELAPVLAEYRE